MDDVQNHIQYAMEQATSMLMAELYVYPLKSCRGISVSSAALSRTGFRWDRQWMVVNEKGRAVTMRVQPKLVLVNPFMASEFFTEPLQLLPSDASLCLRAPGMDELKVPLFGKHNLKDKVQVSVWGWTGVAVDEGPEAAAWFSRYLGRSCRLVRMLRASITSRLTDEKYAQGFQASFSDHFPFLVASKASIELVNRHLKDRISIIRFRPNIVVEGCEAFAEDFWEKFTIGGFAFHGVKLCARCKVPTVNPETAEMETEPTPALQKFRRGDMLSNLESVKHEVFFGQNAVCEESMLLESSKQLVLKVGDTVQVTKTFSELRF